MKSLLIPTLEITDFSTNSGKENIINIEELARSICKALSIYPHFVVIDGYSPTENANNLVNLSKAICAIGSGKSVSDLDFLNRLKVSFTKVKIDSAKPVVKGQVTQYSRTHLPLAAHTDSTYMNVPHNLVAFQCIVADETGGKSIIVPVENILSEIDRQNLELLKSPVFPFGKNFYPIIFGTTGNEEIRYYRSQIEHILASKTFSLTNECQSAIDTLDTVIQQPGVSMQFPLQPGQILFMHNRKVLHGRTGFSSTSDRLLYRVRLHVPSFEFEEETHTTNSTDASTPPSSHPQNNQKVLNSTNNLASFPQESVSFQEFVETVKLNQNPDRLPPSQTILLNMYGEFLVSRGQFTEAVEAFLNCLKISPNDYQSGLALSGLADARGDDRAARAILNQVASEHPLIWEGKPDLRKPTILRIQGMEESAYRIIRRPDGTYTNSLQGGHFSISNFVDRQKYNLITLNILENNIDELKNVPKFDLLLNTIACPDLKKASLLAAARFIDRYPHIPTINDPRSVLLTTRERNYLRLNMIRGVLFSKTEKVRWDGVAKDAIAREIFGLGFVFPFIIRQVGTQTGSTVELVHHKQELDAYFENSPADKEYYVIQFHDYLNERNVYNKTRVFFIDGNFYPVANLFNDTWNVHSGDRYNIMDKTPWTQEEEKTFLNDPVSYLGTENYYKLQQIRDLIGLDFFGIDLTVLPDGTLFIFELNAAMRHNFDHAQNFPHTEPYLKRVSNAFDTMLQRRISDGN